MSFAEAAARLGAAFCLLTGWRPDDFWSATPAEVRLLLDALTGSDGANAGASMGADDLARLKEMFPDG